MLLYQRNEDFLSLRKILQLFPLLVLQSVLLLFCLHLKNEINLGERIIKKRNKKLEINKVKNFKIMMKEKKYLDRIRGNK